jgi:hypothetical protein
VNGGTKVGNVKVFTGPIVAPPCVSKQEELGEFFLEATTTKLKGFPAK